MTEATFVPTRTFKLRRGRRHIAQLCLGCRARIWRDVEDAPLSDSVQPWCPEFPACVDTAGVRPAPVDAA